MKNYWRTAFWILLTVFILTTGFFIHGAIDQGYSLAYLKDSYQHTEDDLQQISRVIKGRLTFDDFKKIIEEKPYVGDSTQLTLNRINITFGKDKKVDSVSMN